MFSKVGSFHALFGVAPRERSLIIAKRISQSRGIRQFSLQDPRGKGRALALAPGDLSEVVGSSHRVVRLTIAAQPNLIESDAIQSGASLAVTTLGAPLPSAAPAAAILRSHPQKASDLIRGAESLHRPWRVTSDCVKTSFNIYHAWYNS